MRRITIYLLVACILSPIVYSRNIPVPITATFHNGSEPAGPLYDTVRIYDGSTLDGTFAYDSLDLTLYTLNEYETRDIDSTRIVVLHHIEYPNGYEHWATDVYFVDDLTHLLDSLYAVIDSTQNQDDWIAHQSTSDSLYDSLLIILDSLEALEAWVSHQSTIDSVYDSILIVLDSLETLEAWISHQTTTDSIYDSILIVLDSLEALESWVAHQSTIDSVYDDMDSVVWANATRTLTALGFALDSADYEDSTFIARLFTELYFDSCQGSASGLTASDIWSYATRDLTDLGFDLDSTHFAANAFTSWLFTTLFFDSAQGSAAGLTAPEVADTLFLRLVSDTNDASVTPYFLTYLLRFTDEIKDSVNKVITDVEGINGWTPLHDNDSLIIDRALNHIANIINMDQTTICKGAADSVFRKGFADAGLSGGSWGDSMTTASWVQGAVAGLTAAEIMDSLFNRLVSDTNANTYLSLLINRAQAALDTLQSQDDWASHQTTLDSVYAICDSLLDTLLLIHIVVDDIHDSTGIMALQTTVDSIYSLADSLRDTLFSLSVAIDSIRDSLQYTVTATGFSTFDPAADSILLANISEIVDAFFDEVLAGHTDAGSFGDIILDSIDAQVSSAGATAVISDADMAAIIDTLFLRLVSDTNTNTYCATLLREASAGGGGGGAFTWSVVVIDSSAGGSSPVFNQPITMNDSAQSLSDPYVQITDVNGAVVFYPSADKWRLVFNGYGYAGFDSLFTVSGSRTDTLYTYTDIVDRTTIFGTLLDNRGQAYDSAEIRAELVNATSADSLLRHGDTIITQTITYDTATSSGAWEMAIYSNDNLTDSSYYVFYFRDKNGKRIQRESGWKVHIPDTVNINFTSLTRWR